MVSFLDYQRSRSQRPLKKNPGSWYRLGDVQLHISGEPVAVEHNTRSKRHICFMVADLNALRERLAQCGIAIVEDNQPMEGFVRFYVRDPGGNRIEIASRT